MLYVHNGILCRSKKENVYANCNNMNRTRGNYTEWNQWERDKYRIISFIWYLKLQSKEATEVKVIQQVNWFTQLSCWWLGYFQEWELWRSFGWKVNILVVYVLLELWIWKATNDSIVNHRTSKKKKASRRTYLALQWKEIVYMYVYIKVYIESREMAQSSGA